MASTRTSTSIENEQGQLCCSDGSYATTCESTLEPGQSAILEAVPSTTEPKCSTAGLSSPPDKYRTEAGARITALVKGPYYLIIHRILPFEGADPNAVTIEDLLNLFAKVGSGTGGLFPYHVIVFPDGTATQVVPFTRAAPGARKYNPVAIQVACVGDFRNYAPTEAQFKKLVSLCTHIVLEMGQLKVVGHSELPDASADPNKVCPGAHLDLKTLAESVASRYSEVLHA